ncbi:phosphotransferase [Demequina aurantiaca]|uniref:phosphotransferase n=1 Tax=Demequina aurantiaca TaxID=676200 RepID=UPI003D34D7F4
MTPATFDITDMSALEPQELASELANLPGWPFGQISLDRVDDGITNVNYFAHNADGVVFLKVPGPGTRAFINWDVSTEATRCAAEQGVGPELLYYDATSGVQATRFLDGYRSAGAADFADLDRVSQIFGLYRRLHAGPLLSTTKTVFDMIDEHRGQLEGAGVTLEPYQREVLDRWDTVQAAYVDAGLDLVPGHNDFNPPNYMFGPDGDLKLIDYDYAANTDRYYEIGGILTLFGYPQSVEHGLISAYLGTEPNPGELARIHLSGIGAAVKWGLWGLYNAAVRDVDFDYDKYGAGMLAPAHHWLKSDRAAWAMKQL